MGVPEVWSLNPPANHLVGAYEMLILLKVLCFFSFFWLSQSCQNRDYSVDITLHWTYYVLLWVIPSISRKYVVPAKKFLVVKYQVAGQNIKNYIFLINLLQTPLKVCYCKFLSYPTLFTTVRALFTTPSYVRFQAGFWFSLNVANKNPFMLTIWPLCTTKI